MKKLNFTLMTILLSVIVNAQSSWTLSNTGFQQGFNVTDFAIAQNGNILAIGTKIVTTPAYTSTPAIYKSTDNGSNWSSVSTTGLSNHNYLFNGICSVNSTLLLSAANNSQDYAVYKSTNNGSSWTLSNTGFQQGFNVTDFAITQNGNILAIGTKIVTTPTYTSTPAIYKSTDNGNSWSVISTAGLTNHNYLYNGICLANSTLLLSAANNSQGYAVYKSTDNGSSWTLSNTGFQQGFNVTDFAITQNGNALAIGTKIVTTPTYTSTPAIYKSTDNGNSWSVISTTGLTNHNYLYNGICSANSTLLMSAANNSQDYAVYRSQSVTGIIDVGLIENIIIYPNPTNDLLTVSIDGQKTILITNINGQTCKSLKTYDNTFSLSDLPTGDYFVSIFNQDNKLLTTCKIVKAK